MLIVYKYNSIDTQSCIVATDKQTVYAYIQHITKHIING